MRVQHQDEELVPGTDAWQWVPQLVPVAAEARVPKEYNSSFERTSLEQELERLGVTHADVSNAVATAEEIDFAALA